MKREGLLLLSGGKGRGDGKSDGSSSRTHVGVIDGGDVMMYMY